MPFRDEISIQVRMVSLLLCVGVSGCDSYVPHIDGLSDRTTATPPFSVNVSLTKRAASKLRQDHETVVVLAEFYGLANATGAKYSDPMGQIYWSDDETVELIGSGIARFKSRNLKTDMLSFFQERKPEVLINVFSGRRASQFNILDCGIFEDSVYLAAKGQIAINCDLIDHTT